jgi:hypothetical protein
MRDCKHHSILERELLEHLNVSIIRDVVDDLTLTLLRA